jgi:hypothetical protein
MRLDRHFVVFRGGVVDVVHVVLQLDHLFPLVLVFKVFRVEAFGYQLLSRADPALAPETQRVV